MLLIYTNLSHPCQDLPAIFSHTFSHHLFVTPSSPTLVNQTSQGDIQSKMATDTHHWKCHYRVGGLFDFICRISLLWRGPAGQQGWQVWDWWLRSSLLAGTCQAEKCWTTWAVSQGPSEGWGGYGHTMPRGVCRAPGWEPSDIPHHDYWVALSITAPTSKGRWILLAVEYLGKSRGIYKTKYM